MIYLQIIAIAWFSNLIVSFYVSRCVKKKLPIRKPFGCEMCLAFWIGIVTFYFIDTNNCFIFASITSLTAVILKGITSKLNAN